MNSQQGKKRRKLGVALVAGLALVATLAGCSKPAPQEEAVVGLTFIPNIQFAAFYNAESAGWYTENSGISIRHHGSSEGLFTALTSDQEQFVVAGGDEILQARSQGIDVVAVATYYRQYPAVVIVPQDSSITSIADLAGHKVGVPGKFGESWFALLTGLRHAGLTQDDVTVVEIGYTPQPALTTGQVDALVGFSNSDLLNFAAAGIPVRSINPEAPLVSICLATTGAYLKAHPDEVSLVVAGMVRGMEEAIADPAKTLDTAAEFIPSFHDEVRDQAAIVLPATSALFMNAEGKVSPTFDPTQWSAMAKAMEDAGLIPAGVEVESAYTNDFS